MDLFSASHDSDPQTGKVDPKAPLAVRMRPRSLAELAGQTHLLQPGSPLTRLLSHSEGSPSQVSSVILWGPPGIGKTTIAYLIAQTTKRKFVELSAVTSGVKDVREVIEAAKRTIVTTGQETVLFIDEVHRFSKTQQDALLPSVENRWITLVAATTENPSFSVIAPLLSRSILLTLEPIERTEIIELLRRAVSDERGLQDTVQLHDDAAETIAELSGGDARRALTILEAVAGFVLEGAINEPQPRSGAGQPAISAELVTQAILETPLRYDRDGDQHYDIISAFIKSIRGSDPDATLHYLARMLVAGEDPRFIARRLIISASEDIGMADPQGLVIAQSAAEAVAQIGMPEGRIILAQAAVYLAMAPKSNASYNAINAAIADVRKLDVGQVPFHLRDSHYPGAKELGHGLDYRYAHDWPHAVAPQQYLPDRLSGRRYYKPTDRGLEKHLSTRLQQIQEILHSQDHTPDRGKIPDIPKNDTQPSEKKN